MANCHELFIEFNGAIRLTDARRKSLKGSRKDLRRKIRKYFKDEKPNEIMPKFSGQGSLIMDVIINPIPRKVTIKGEEKNFLYYDVDDGVYFIGNENKDQRKAISTYHQWIYDAVNDHTKIDSIDKNTCVRVLFSDGHNIDLPIYYKQGSIPELAHKANGWILSDPMAFSDWFNTKADKEDQLRRFVRYIKAWKDFREYNNSSRSFPSGLILTILSANHFYKHDRDDISFKETLVLIEAELLREFKCLRPTTPAGEDLMKDYAGKNDFMKCLSNLVSSAKKAIEETNQKKSCEIWQKELGDRFSCSNAKDEEEKENSAGLKILVGTHKPYCAY